MIFILLLCYAMSNDNKPNGNSFQIANYLTQLFHVYLSATITQVNEIIKGGFLWRWREVMKGGFHDNK